MRIQSTPPTRVSNLQSNPNKNAIGSAIDKLTVSPFVLGEDALDVSMGACYAAGGFPQGFKAAGIAAGVAHAGLAIADFFRCDGAGEVETRHHLQSSVGHALSAAGHIFGALGAGVWATPLLAAGVITSTVEDYRWRNS